MFAVVALYVEVVALVTF